MAYPDLGTARQSTANKLKQLLNQDLKEICRQEGLQVSGVKAQLQARILNFMDESIGSRDMQAFERLRYRVNNRGASPPIGGTGTDRSGGVSVTANASPARPPSQYNRPSIPPMPGQRTHVSAPPKLNFKPSPFYAIQDNITRVTELPSMPHNRHSVTVPVPLSDLVCERLQADASLKVMLYCSILSSDLQSYYDIKDVAFPGSIEVKVNQEEVKSNYKGLKNKPGTTKPADLTPYLRKQPRYPNNLQINYALNSSAYSFVVNLVQKASPEALVERLKRGRVITKDTVLREMSRKARDPDIEATSSVMSLKDPISTMRMDLPCRSTICTHSQCFDALSFLQLQEQAPTWTCPVCSKVISYEALAVDHYVLDILSSTARSAEQVVIEPEGAWKEVSQADDEQRERSQARAPYDDDSDDLVEISNVKSGAPVKKEYGQSSTPVLAQHMTPPLSSREASVSQNGRNKRPSAVIDLTMSDDDDEPRRPAKRPHVATNYNTPSSNSDKSQEPQQQQQQHLQHRPLPTTLYTGFAQMRSPQSANGTSPRPPDFNGQTTQRMPWPANYSTYAGSPWNGGQHPN